MKGRYILHRRMVPVLLLAVVLTGMAGAQELYWDNPRTLVRQNARFPLTTGNDQVAFGLWQERRAQEGWPQYFLSLAVKHPADKDWTLRRNVIGPVTLAGDESQIFTAVVTKSGRLWIAVLSAKSEIQLYRSDDEGRTFTLDKTLRAPVDLLAPKLFLSPQDKPVLVLNEGATDSFRIAGSFYDGSNWPELAILTPETNNRLNFQPFLAFEGNRIFLVYQSLLSISRPTYQIFLKTSQDMGNSWSIPQRLSDYSEDPNILPNEYDNQRPQVFYRQGRLHVAWERRSRGIQPSIIASIYSPEGKRLDSQEITSGTYTAGNPQFFDFQGRLYLTWFDNRQDYFEQRISVLAGAGWTDPEVLSEAGNSTVFGRPIHLGNDLFFFWQSNFNGAASVVLLQPLRHVDPPQIIPVNYREGAKTNKTDVTFELKFPPDRSGITGYNFVLDQEPSTPVEKILKYNAAERVKTASAQGGREGVWYLHVIIQDLAGNWSEPANSTLVLKTTPPAPVLVTPPAVDGNGYLQSNSFTMDWKPTSADTVAYTWRLDQVSSLGTTVDYKSLKLPPPALSAAGTPHQASFDNLENGVYALTVAPVDEAGNRGQAYSYFIKLNKFRPFTRIFFVDASTDPFGRIQMSISGRGFTSEGIVDRVILDKDGQAPWDYEFDTSRYRLASDRLIDQLVLEDLEPGVYRVGVRHQNRGLLFTGPVVKVEPSGTVKIGDFRDLDKVNWTFPEAVTVFFSVNAVGFWLVMVFLMAVVVFSTRQLVGVRTEVKRLEVQAEALFDEKYYQTRTPSERRKEMRRKGLSLRIKFVASLLALTIAVISMLAVTLGFFITENSQRSLGTALQQRTEVLLDSLVSGARTYLPSGNTLELSLIPAQISAMAEARYTTISGKSSQDKPGFSYVWASNDPDISKKVGSSQVSPGVSKIGDPIEELYTKLQGELNAKADQAVSELASQVDDLNKKAGPYTTKTDAESQRILADYQVQITRLQNEINRRLSDLGRVTGSVPAYKSEALFSSQTLYTFYKPVIYRSANDKNYVKGLVRLQVSTETILKQISQARDQLVFLTMLVALAALVLGLLGALILSSITINPIKKLVKAVEKIRDTEDKAQLHDFTIDIRTKDELADLATTINQMTQGLVHAAEANKDLLLGKATQKTFIPLDVNSKDRKLTTGYRDLPEAEIFGYYEGAKGVSGDYYDFRQLDNKDGDNPHSPWYGFIKCDVSGKGIVGALIMFTVASIVVNFFRNWTSARDSKDIQLSGMVANVNDLLESLQFKGRFAALNTGILNVKTGKIRLCHAGDNVIHVWRGRTMSFETLTLPSAPATGQIADLFARNLYKHFDLTLESGDTLLFYTDGIEESQSKFRDSEFNVVAFFDPDDPSTKTTPGSMRKITSADGREIDQQAIDNEPLHEPGTPAVPPSPRNPQGTPASEGNERLNAIIEAFYKKTTYQLVKKYPALPEETLTFDFSTCDGSAKQVITALVSIDRIFRLVPDPRCTAEDKIKLDVVQKQFLESHFVEYRKYFRGEGVKVAEPNENVDDSEYIWFDHLKEDDQFDDLTLLAIRKK